MYLYKKLYFYFNMICSISFILILGIIGYHRFLNVNINNNPDIKFYAENLLYLAVIFTIAQISFSLFFIARSRNIYNRLDKIIDLSKSKSYTISSYLKRLGKLGQKINFLIYELNALNKMRASRINSFDKINNLLLGYVDISILIADVHGIILGISKRFLEVFDVEKKDIMGNNLIFFLSDKNLKEIITEMMSVKNIITRPNLKWEIGGAEVDTDSSFYPIFDSDNILTHMICFMEKESVIKKLAVKTKQIVQDKTGIFKKVKNLFKRK